MSVPGPNEDLDKIDGRSFIAWLIYTGAGGLIASTPMSFYHGLITAFDRPVEPVYNTDDFLRVMTSEMAVSMLPMFMGAVFAGILAATIVLCARAGIRLGLLVLVLLGGGLGLIGVVLLLEPDTIALALGGVTGGVAGAAMAIARRLLIRGG